MKTTAQIVAAIRPAFVPAFTHQQEVVLKANDIKLQATTTLREVVRDLWDKNKDATSELTIKRSASAFREAVIELASSMGYDDARQWGTKFLVKVDPDAFRQRAQKSNKGKPLATAPKPLNEKQMAFEIEAIRHVAARLKLTGDVIEKLVTGVVAENAKLAKDSPKVGTKSAA